VSDPKTCGGKKTRGRRLQRRCGGECRAHLRGDDDGRDIIIVFARHDGEAWEKVRAVPVLSLYVSLFIYIRQAFFNLKAVLQIKSD
jgi:hypothetical protein